MLNQCFHFWPMFRLPGF